MWSPDALSRTGLRAGRLAAAGLLGAALLGGCTARPLYSSTVAPAAAAAAGPAEVKTASASVHVEPVSTREAQEVRNELIFLLARGRGNPTDAPYALALSAYAYAENSATTLITGVEQAPTSQILTFVGRYTLKEAATGRVIGSGERRATAALDTPRQPFSARRTLRDAQDRAARELAAFLASAVAADLATGRNAAQPAAAK